MGNPDTDDIRHVLFNVKSKQLHVYAIMYDLLLQGLYPESHGIVDNNMYDTDIKEKFSLSSPNASDPRWWGGEPVSIASHQSI
jgi:hypothetical protein